MTEKQIFDALSKVWIEQQVVNSKFELWATPRTDNWRWALQFNSNNGYITYRRFVTTDVELVELAHDGISAKIVFKGE